MSSFLKALQGVNHEGVAPIWFMRQAGRYMHAYRALRERYTFLEICKTPELLTEVTLQPIKRFGFDAAIVFSDILLLLESFGCGVAFSDGAGPIIQTSDYLKNGIWDKDLKDLQPVYDGILLVKEQLQIPLLGFSGAPYTLLTYAEPISFIYSNPELVVKIFHSLEDAIVQHLSNQIAAGCSAVQIFDTAAGLLPPLYFISYCIQPLQRIIKRLKSIYPDIPVIVFVRGASWRADLLRSTGADALSVDWMVDIGDVRRTVGKGIALQGNLDPSLMLASPEACLDCVSSILQRMENDPGFIFGLGHGVLPKTSEDQVERVVHFVRNR